MLLGNRDSKNDGFFGNIIPVNDSVSADEQRGFRWGKGSGVSYDEDAHRIMIMNFVDQYQWKGASPGGI